MKNRAIVATTTFSKSYDLRARLAVKTAEACKEHGYDLVIIDGGSHPEFLADIMRFSARVFHREAALGMGFSRREAMAKAGIIAALGDGDFVLWMEPEKYTLVPEIEKMSAAMVDAGADLAIPDRGPLDSYPLAQQLAEPLGNLAFERITDRKLDIWSGSRLMSQRALTHFLDYQGEYGDKWDSIFIPVLRCIAFGLTVISVPVNYVHPPEQTVAEESPEMLEKRVAQLYNLVPAMVAEAKLLKLIF